MSTPTRKPERNRWMDWAPEARIIGNSAESKPTKPSKPGFVGFEGAISGESPKIHQEAEGTEVTLSVSLLNRAGVRLMRIDGVPTIGVWSDLDGPDIRTALRVLESDGLPIRYLDGPGIPDRYRSRLVPGEPLPANVRTEMEREPAEPWKVRDRMLKGTP